MKSMLLLASGALLFALPGAYAQTVLAHSPAPPPPGSALPPPGINSPGAKPQSIPLPSLGIPPSVAPAARQDNSNDQSPPDVAVSTGASGDKVETYSRNGHVYMVRVTPKNGVPQTFRYGNPNGSLAHDSKLGPVAPVYYTIYKWGGPGRPASASSGG